MRATRPTVRRRGFLVAAVIVAAAAMAVGCNGPLTPEARTLLESTYVSYDSGDDNLTIARADSFLANNSSSPRAAEAYYLRGMAKRRSSDKAATEDLQAARNRTPSPEVRAKASVALGDIAYENGDMALAENMYRSAIDDAKQESTASERAHYRLGCALQRQGRWKEADVEFDRVIFLFPEGGLATAAARRTHSTAWTVQAGVLNSRARADALAASLSAAGLEADVRPVVLGGRPAFAVRSGQFATYAEASAHLPAVRAVQQDAFVTTTR